MKTCGNKAPDRSVQTVPFEDAEEVWFWFIQTYQARNEGARIVAGQGLFPRPCEPLDVLKILERLYRNRVLLWDHMLVLRHYGYRMMPPDPRRPKEMRAAGLWREAMGKLEAVFVAKAILRPPSACIAGAEFAHQVTGHTPPDTEY